MKKDTEWPECPRCSSPNIMVAGLNAECAECSFSGDIREITESEVLTKSRMAASLLPMSESMVMFFHKGLRKAKDSDMNLRESAFSISRKLAHEGVWATLRKRIKDGATFSPVFVGSYTSDSTDVVLVPADTSVERNIARSAFSSWDMMSALWVSPSDTLVDFAVSGVDPWNVCDSGYFHMQTHFYGAPSQWRSTPFKVKNGVVKFGRSVFRPASIDSWISQPICWKSAKIVPGRIRPTFMSYRQFDNGLYINAFICEDLDGQPSASIAIKEASAKDFVVVPLLDGEMSDPKAVITQRISLMEGKMDGLGATVVTSSDKEWGVEESEKDVMSHIYDMPIWENFNRK